MERQNQYFPQSVPHPGETLEEKLQEMGMGPKEFALRTGKPEKTIIAVLKGESSLTADMAVQFELVTKIPAHFWMNHQRGYDEYLARERRKAVIQAAVPWARQFPLAELMEKGWLRPAVKMQDRALALLDFFGFSDHEAWEAYFFRRQLKVVFSISLAQTREPYALSAWLRQGELQAAALESKAYSARKFKESLPAIRAVLASRSKGSLGKLQDLCLAAGVKVVQTPCLRKAALSASTRWLNDNPLIQLGDRPDSLDRFRCNFFHAAGHILLHGKKDVFLEGMAYSDHDPVKEQEADAFASNWMGSEVGVG